MRLIPDIDTTPGILTPYLLLDIVLLDYAHCLQDILANNFVGMYSSGSLAIGDFDLTSDVDFIVVTNMELSDDDVKNVQAAHANLIARDSRWVKHLEYSFFPKEKILSPSSPFGPAVRNDLTGRMLWYFENGSSSIENSDHDNTLVTRWTVREKGVAILGLDPALFMLVVTPYQLRTEIKNSLRGWGVEVLTDWSPYYNRFHQAFFVLHYCRVLQDLHEGRVTSKLDGVKWAKRHLDPKWHELIDYCWHEREDTTIHVSQPAAPEIFEQTVAFSEYATRLGEEYQLPDEP